MRTAWTRLAPAAVSLALLMLAGAGCSRPTRVARRRATPPSAETSKRSVAETEVALAKAREDESDLDLDRLFQDKPAADEGTEAVEPVAEDEPTITDGPAVVEEPAVADEGAVEEDPEPAVEEGDGVQEEPEPPVEEGDAPGADAGAEEDL